MVAKRESVGVTTVFREVPSHYFFFLQGQSRNRVANVYTELSDRVEKAATLMINGRFSCRAQKAFIVF